MLRSPTLDKLRDLNLLGMARALEAQMASAEHQALSFDDRIGLMVDTEQEDRENRRLFRYLKAAKLRDNACVEDLDFRHPRGLDHSLVLTLAEGRWIDAHQSVLVIGATGLGKTYISCALAQAAVRKGHTALYLRFPRLIDELAVARVDGRMPRLLAAWARVEVLLIDDLGMQPLTSQQGADLLEVIDDRHQRRSTIVTSQLPVNRWHESLGDATVADAIMDRLTHNAHRIELRKARSLRGPQTPDTEHAQNSPDTENDAAAAISGTDREKRRPTKP
jgi:DNA replication protein DnaC